VLRTTYSVNFLFFQQENISRSDAAGAANCKTQNLHPILTQSRQDAKNCKNKLPFFKAGLGFFFFSSCPSCLRGEKVLIFVLVAALLRQVFRGEIFSVFGFLFLIFGIVSVTLVL